MKYSVIVPMYNSKSTIKSTIDSVMQQTYQEPIEIIIVSDGSDDGCEKIVEDLILNNKTNRTIELIKKSNGGVSSARNMGIKKATGEYIAFLDSDDMWHPQKLEITMQTIEKYRIDFLGHGYTLKNNFNKTFIIDKPKKISFMKLLVKNFAVTPSVVVKREICKLFNEKMTHTEDHELWLRIALKTEVYFLDLPLAFLGREELSTGGLSSNKWAMRKGELQMYKNIVWHKKSLMFIYSFLVCFSLMKHLRHIIKDSFAKN
ncbi:MAG: glycosyltransferase family A protein [Sulfurimonas sp.]|nr:glycosyltransferase family A protein [Sulfurimonas sp.]